MIKTIAIILIIISASKIGFAFASRLDRRRDTLIGFKDALALMEGEIAFAKNSPADAFLHLSRQCAGVVGSFFGYIHKKMVCEKLSAAQAWDEATDKYSSKMCITNEDATLMRQFCLRLGKSDVENELKNIYNTTVKLNMQLASAQNECDTNKKIYKSGGILCGILLAVLLV